MELGALMGSTVTEGQKTAIATGVLILLSIGILTTTDFSRDMGG